jgi:hypothetical protein
MPFCSPPLRGGSLLSPLFSGDKKVAKKSLRLNFWGLKCDVNLAPSPVNLRALPFEPAPFSQLQDLLHLLRPKT